MFMVCCLLTISTFAQDYKLRKDTVKQQIINYKDSIVNKQGNINFYFRINSFEFEPSFSDNASQLVLLDDVMSDEKGTFALDSLVINATASIDGPADKNAILAQNRANTIRNLLINRYSHIDSEKFLAHSIAERWDEFRELVDADDSIPFKSSVIRVLEDSRHSFDTKEWLLKTMHNRVTWNYLAENIFPKLRYGASVVLYYNIEKQKYITTKEIEVIDTVFIQKPAVTEIKPIIKPVEPEYEWRPLFAAKTNLLFDAILMPNVEIEVPIGERWSIAGEWIFPWWTFDNKTNYRHTYELLHGNVEVKYWLGNRTDKLQLTGWSLGLYGGMGTYDFEYKSKGYQGEFTHGGLSVGYAHTINKRGNLRMEYSLGVGYMQSDYRYHESVYETDNDWHSYRHNTSKFSWFGPTRAKISLVWMLHTKKKIK